MTRSSIKNTWQKIDRPPESLRRRLLGIIATTVLLLVGLGGTVAYLLLANMERNLWESRQNDAVRSGSLSVASFMGQVSRSLDVPGMWEITEAVAETESFFPAWLADNPEFLEVILLTPSGEIIGSVAQEEPLLANPFTIRQSQWFLDAAEGKGWIGGVEISADDQPYLIVSRPADNDNIIAARLDMTVLWNVVDAVQFGQTGNAYIIEPSGQIIAHSDREKVFNNVTLAGREEMGLIGSAETYRWSGRYTNIDNTPVIARSQGIPNSEWIIVTELARSEATSTGRLGSLALFASGLALTTFAILIISRIVTAEIFKPLDNLRRSVRRIAEGNFDETVTISRSDEVGELAGSFNEMTEALRIRDSRIAAQNQALADEVRERKMAQENLQKLNAELVHSSRYKDQFLATMSHELRTPLNAILGMSEALTVPVYGELNGQQERAVRHISESGTHLLSLIDDILDLSKISAGRSPLEYSAVNVQQVTAAALRMVRPIVNARSLQLKTRLDPRVQAIMADDRRLKQVLVNLLNNAVKFTDEGGTVTLEVTGDVRSGKVNFIVTDTGIGIPDEGLAQLFEPFVQLDGGLNRQYEGTGLGLTLVKRLVDLHGGTINVESTVGIGSRFTVALPWREAFQRPDTGLSPAPKIVETGKASAARGASILLAEDREANILTLLDYLTIKGFEVIVARNGREAVEMTRINLPDLILMDIQMPEMNGLEATRLIRKDPVTAHIPIIALTALAMPGDRERCMEAGANDYISKPVSLRQLVQTIENHLHVSPTPPPISSVPTRSRAAG